MRESFSLANRIHETGGEPGDGPVLRADFVVSAQPRHGETPARVFERLAAVLEEREGEILHLMVYGSLAAREEIDGAMQASLGASDWPVTWVEGASCEGGPLAGVQALAAAVPVERIRLGGRVVGSVFEDGDARHCLLGGLGPNAVSLTPAAQEQQLFANLEAALELGGFRLADVVRTWFFNEEILAWYDDFNRVRNALYRDVKFRTGSLPASTGVAGRNPAEAALTGAAWAVQPLHGSARILAVASPLQCPAPDYGSSFSRAVEIESGGQRRLLVSGTASIAPTGETVRKGDPAGQVELTMEVVEAILRSRGMNFADVDRATAYFKQPEYRAHFDAWCGERKLRVLPVVPVHCDICRDDLLFEIEVDARTGPR